MVPRRRVDDIEFELHRELTDCMNDPGKLSIMVERSIARIEDELASMPGDLVGIRAELEEVLEDLGRVEESWLRRRITTDRWDVLVGELESRRDLLEGRLEQVSPERRNVLEENQEILRGAKDYLETLRARQEFELPSWKFSWLPDVAESVALQKFRESKYNAFPRDPNRIPEILDRVLTEFSMTAVFREDRVDIIGGIELEILDSDTHPYASLVRGS